MVSNNVRHSIDNRACGVGSETCVGGKAKQVILEMMSHKIACSQTHVETTVWAVYLVVSASYQLLQSRGMVAGGVRLVLFEMATAQIGKITERSIRVFWGHVCERVSMVSLSTCPFGTRNRTMVVITCHRQRDQYAQCIMCWWCCRLAVTPS